MPMFAVSISYVLRQIRRLWEPALISESDGELLAAKLNGGLNSGNRWVKGILSLGKLIEA